MITVHSDELHFALSFLNDIVPKSPHIPILENILVETWGKHMHLYGKDLNKVAKFKISAEYDEQEKFVIPLKPFLTLVTQLKKTDDVIKLRLTRTKLVVTDHKGSRVTFNLQDVDNFPNVATPPEAKYTFDIFPEVFADRLGIASFAQSDMLILTAIHLYTNNGQLILEATNKFSGGRTVLDEEFDQEFDIAVSGDIAKTLRKVAKISDSEWLVEISDRDFQVTGDNWYISFQLMSETFPDIRMIYNNSKVVSSTISREDVSTVLSKLSTISGSSNRVVITIEDNKMTFEAKSELGESVQEIDGTFSEDAKVILYLGEIHKILQQLKSDNFLFIVGKNNEPVLISDEVAEYFTLAQL